MRPSSTLLAATVSYVSGQYIYVKDTACIKAPTNAAYFFALGVSLPKWEVDVVTEPWGTGWWANDAINCIVVFPGYEVAVYVDATGGTSSTYFAATSGSGKHHTFRGPTTITGGVNHSYDMADYGLANSISFMEISDAFAEPSVAPTESPTTDPTPSPAESATTDPTPRPTESATTYPTPAPIVAGETVNISGYIALFALGGSIVSIAVYFLVRRRWEGRARGQSIRNLCKVSAFSVTLLMWLFAIILSKTRSLATAWSDMKTAIYILSAFAGILAFAALIIDRLDANEGTIGMKRDHDTGLELPPRHLDSEEKRNFERNPWG